MQNRFQSYFNISASLIKLYDAKTPFAIFLKNYFSQHKKHGSTDRKKIATLCYSYFRLGNALKSLSIEEKMKLGFFICNEEHHQYDFLFDNFFLSNWSNDFNKRIEFVETIYPNFLNEVFSFKEEIGGINSNDNFIKSHFVQPNLFLRIRPNKKNIVLKKLLEMEIPFQEIGEYSLSLINTTAINDIVELNKEAVVQDLSSQQTSSLIELVKQQIKEPIRLWDCCAASGGKTILAFDILKPQKITVSDNRASILHNLKKRLADAGIHRFESFVADLAKPLQLKENFNFIICDVPCSGSGTWSRTPEQISNFKQSSFNEFCKLQFSIANNVSNYLEKNGYLLYITCSIFKKENELVVEKLLKETSLKLVEQRYIEGFNIKADTMFAALLQKVS